MAYIFKNTDSILYFSHRTLVMNAKSVFYIFLLFGTFLFSQHDAEALGDLPEVVSESSGLIFHNGKLITHNDSGNTPVLYEIDTVSHQITRTITVTNVENVDWEDIAQDEQYIYIGDFGNNKGTRTDLSIYRIDKQAYDQDDTVTAERIDFSYGDQTEFTDNGNSDWDAEAFFALDDQLVILTKQWQNNGTVAYSVPKTPGTYLAKIIDSYNSNGLVTGATYNPLSRVLFIIGYSSLLSPFVLRFDKITDTVIFTEEAVRTNLNIGLAQVEGITYSDINTYYFTSELFTRTSPSVRLEPRLFSFKTDDVPDGEDPSVDPEPEPIKEGIVVFKSSGSNILEYEVNTNKPILAQAVFDTTGKRVRYIEESDINENSIDITTLKTAVYYLTFYFADSVISIPFSRN